MKRPAKQVWENKKYLGDKPYEDVVIIKAEVI